PTDFEGTPRPSGGGVDIGYDEFATASSPVATHFGLSSPASATAGSSFSVTVSALTNTGAVDGTYRGTVHFTSTDGQAGLPANYTFTATDNGTHTFTNTTLKTSGSQTVTANDALNGAITSTASLTVSAAAANTLQVSAPATATAGATFSTTVTLKD